MADYLEVENRDGSSLHYLPPDRFANSNLPTSYFRPRIARPFVLRIAHVTAESPTPSPTATQATDLTARPYTPSFTTPIISSTTLSPQRKRRKIFSIYKLAGSKENALRFLRHFSAISVSSDSTNVKSVSTRTEPHRFSRISASPSTVSDMLSGAVDSDAHSRTNSRGGGPVSALGRRPGLTDDIRTASNESTQSTMSSVLYPGAIGDEKPVASGNGLAISIALAEPVLFLQGFDHTDDSSRTTTMLRGSLHLKVSKSAKIKAISLKFKGKAETEWPEGIPPKKTEFRDTESIMNHTWPFFNAQFQTAEQGHGADHVRPLKGPSTTTIELSPGVTSSSFDQFQRSSRARSELLTPREAKRLSLQVDHSRSSGKGDNPTVAQKGYLTFTPGDYIYNFELPIDSRLPESIEVELGRVKYELEAVVERSGAFRANLVGSKEVIMIRTPAENSLETVEPIAISRDWEDQLHYDIVISGKSFPLGAQVPIAFKLTPLAKVACHRIKVYVTENIQYYTSNKRVHRLEPTRKIQLFEKRADAPSTSAYPGSTVRITAGGGVSYDGREAAARGDESVSRDMTNLLGDLSGEHNVGPTEMEFNVQLPSCHAMQEKERAARIHFDTTFQGIQVHHWIKIVMRLSKPDAIDPSKRRHFEISIDSPFNILSCRATQANTALPAYSSPDSAVVMTDHYECGCPGAARRRNSPSSLLPSLSTLRNGVNASSSGVDDSESPTGVARPPAAHVNDSNAVVSRPMHLLRAPSFNPPAFSDDDPPPPLVTPPPKYESLVVGDPRGGLADYFSRLADETGEEEDSVTSPSRMEIPLTPGGRLNRSMDERRTWLPIGNAVTQ